MNVLAMLLLAAQALVFQNAPASSAQDEPPGSISGQVVNALTGDPVKGAQVSVQCATRINSYRQTTTDRLGMFNASGVGPGSCTVTANHRDYSGVLGLGQTPAAAQITSGRETTGVQVKLMPGGSISGRVLNDDGEPLEFCSVQVYAPLHLQDNSNLQARGGTQTDDQGEFHITGLAPDRYLLHAQCNESLPVERLLAPAASRPDEPAESWLPVFYPNSPSAAGATVLNIMPGTDLQNVDFKLRTTPVVTVRGSAMAAANVNVNVQLVPDAATGNPGMPLGGGYDPKDGTFRVEFVPPGSYKLVVLAMTPQQDSVAFSERRITIGKARPEPVQLQLQTAPPLRGIVEDSAGSDSGPAIRGNQLAVVMRPSLGGRREPMGPASQPKGYVQFVPDAPSPFAQYRQGDVHQDGNFEVKGLGPGRYHVRYIATMAQAIVESIHYGDAKLEGDQIEIGEGPPGLLRIVLGAKGARVQIHLPDDSSGEKKSWSVYMIPAGKGFQAAAGSMPVLSGASGSDLLYDGLQPGKYIVFGAQQTALNGGFNDRLFELLQARLQPEEVAAGSTTKITPKLFTSEDINRLALAFLQGETQ